MTEPSNAAARSGPGHATSGVASARSASLPPPSLLAAALALVAFGDWLFWGHEIGWTAALFALALLIACVAANRDLIARPHSYLLLLGSGGMIAAMILDPSLLAVGLFAMGLATFLCLGMPGALRDLGAWIEALALAGSQAILRCIGDAIAVPAALMRLGGGATMLGLARAWVLPVLGTALFLELFATANPVIGAWLDAIDVNRVLNALPTPHRVMFWCATGGVVWLFLRTRLAHVEAIFAEGRTPFAAVPAGFHHGVVSWLFSPAAIVRSMIAFNVMFALQNALDAGYLWGHSALPPGMSFAAYAHRGAYPLMVTAVLAATFVLIAFRQDSPSRDDRAVRALMYVWVGQNVVLVVSAIWRMMLYVEAYSLTHMRVAVLVWMGLVALGLVLIVARFWFQRTNSWLVQANATALAVVLYASPFADVGGYIAAYNVRHSREVSGRGVHLDLGYLRALGPSALPAVNTFISSIRPDADGFASIAVAKKRAEAIILEVDLRRQQLERRTNWRTWTLRSYLSAADVQIEQPASTRP